MWRDNVTKTDKTRVYSPRIVGNQVMDVGGPDGIVVGRIMKAAAVPVDTSWTWTLAFGHHEDRTPTHGYAETREAAMTAFAKSWRRE
jgi:hypothetical protein